MAYVEEAIRLIEEGKTPKEVATIVGKAERTVKDKLRAAGYGSTNGVWSLRGEVTSKPATNPVASALEGTFTVEEVSALKSLAARELEGAENAENISDWLMTIHGMHGDKRKVSYQIPSELDDELTEVSDRLRFQKTEIVMLALREFIDRL